jgi:hypothetical protein
MRKLFWGCVVGGSAVAAGVLSTAHFAVRHPDSPVGRFLFGASQAAAVMSPFTGFAPAPAQPDHAARSVSGSEESAEVVEPSDLAPTPEPAPAAPIVIPEDEPVPAAPIPVLSDTLCPVQFPEAFPVGAPPVMPRCEEESETFERIGVDFNDPASLEKLHMPKSVEDGEEQEPEACPLGGCADKVLRMFHKMMKHAGEEENSIGAPPAKRPGKPHGLFKTQIYEFSPAQEKVDTMEFRATDRSLSDYGFGPL